MTSGRQALSIGVNVVWFAAFVVTLGGYALPFRFIESRIDERVADITRSAQQLRADEGVLTQRPRLVGERMRLQARLARVELGDDATRLVAHFLHDAARITARHRTKIATITATGPAVSAPQAPAIADPFQAIPLEVIIEGRYIDLLATLGELSATPVLAQIDLTSLARKNVDAPDATLSAVLHVSLERVAQPAALSTAWPEVRDVRSRPR